LSYASLLAWVWAIFLLVLNMQMNAVSAISTSQHVTNSAQIVATISKMVLAQHRMETPYVIWLAQETRQKLVAGPFD
jgi:hypothetical protein